MTTYFDHARCPSCGATFDPEQVVPRGDGFQCPACGAQLGMKALFGLAAAFDEEEPPDVTLDDLVPGSPAAPPPRRAEAGTPASGETALEILRKIRQGD